MTRSWLSQPVKKTDAVAEAGARARQQRLTKPAGALGGLEAIAVRLAGLQGRVCPQLERCHISVFAADHGIAAAGVSAYPQAVTAQMILNFAAGGAAISVLARHSSARFEVVNLGTVEPLPAHPAVLARHSGARFEVVNLGTVEPLPAQPAVMAPQGGARFEVGDLETLEPLPAHPAVVARVLGPGTADISRQPAMTEDQLGAALDTGAGRVDQARGTDADLFIAGEMGIGNTTSATALAAALLDRAPETLLGPGTGVEGAGLALKLSLIRQALGLHRAAGTDPVALLRCLGGFEIAAMTGAYLRAGQLGMPVLVDGFISTVAALLAVRIQPQLSPWLLYSHRSAEPGHKALLETLGATPLLALDMRLGEGSGAALVWPLLQSACRLHGEMATFDEAGVSAGGA